MCYKRKKKRIKGYREMEEVAVWDAVLEEVLLLRDLVK